jgi:hypothetical protein
MRFSNINTFCGPTEVQRPTGRLPNTDERHRNVAQAEDALDAVTVVEEGATFGHVFDSRPGR